MVLVFNDIQSHLSFMLKGKGRQNNFKEKQTKTLQVKGQVVIN